MATNVNLTADLERFARSCVEDGRFNNVSEVVRAGLRLLQDNEERRRAFNAMLDSVAKEAARDGTVALDDMLVELDAIIDAADR